MELTVRQRLFILKYIGHQIYTGGPEGEKIAQDFVAFDTLSTELRRLADALPPDRPGLPEQRKAAEDAWGLAEKKDLAGATNRMSAALDEVRKIHDTAEQERKVLLGRVHAAVPRDMAADLRRPLSARADVLAKSLSIGPRGVPGIEPQIKTLEDDAAAAQLLAQARRGAQTALDTARDAFRAARAQLDEGSYTFLEKDLATLGQTFGTATDGPGFDKAEKAAQAFPGRLATALDFARTLTGWQVATQLFIKASVPTGGDAQKDARDDADKVRDDAIALSRAGKFPEAKAKLADFDTKPNIDGGKLADLTKFLERQATFIATEEAMVNAVVQARIAGADAHKDVLKKARTEAIKKALPNTGIQLLDNAVSFAQPLAALAARINGFDQALNRHPDFRNAMTEARKGTATAFDGLDPTIVDEATCLSDFKSFGAWVEPLRTRNPPEKGALDIAWTAFGNAVKNKDVNAEKTTRDDVARFRPLAELEDRLAALRPVLTPDVLGYDPLKDVTSRRTGGDFAGALSAMGAAETLARGLADYVAARTVARAVRASMPPAAVAQGVLADQILKDAETLATNGNPQAATLKLADLSTAPELAGLVADVSDYRALLARVRKRHTRVVKLVDPAKPKKTVADSMSAATDLADKRYRFADAIAALETHDRLLDKAQAYGAARQQALAVLAAIERTVKSRPTEESAIFADGPTRKQLQESRLAAEKLATAGEFDKARDAFDKILTAAKPITRRAAQSWENADKVNSNAGHSLDRHGPDVSDPLLVRRLQTGKPPEWTGVPPYDKESFTGASSRFESMEDWLAGREIGAQRALSEEGVDVSATAYPVTEPEPATVSFEIDHGKPIDKAFVGVSKSFGVNPDTGEMLEGRTYDSFEEMSGLTRSYVGFVWEYDLIAGDKPKDKADYITKYKAANAGKDPKEIKGRWVMMQQFPVAAGWDENLKDYV